eukprot:12935965-Prorocentrum_lima.AAC.1
MVKKIEDIDNLIEWKQDNLGTIKQQLRRLHEMDPPMNDEAQSVQVMEPDDLDEDTLLNSSNAGLAKKLQKHEQSIAGIAKNVFILLESLGMGGEHRPT